jgi:hypothetical protein
MITELDIFDARILDKARRAAEREAWQIVKRKVSQRASDRRIAAEARDNRKARRYGTLASMELENA